MDGRQGGIVAGWMDRRVDGWMVGCLSGLVFGSLDR
jgi:hypothetical protein